MIIYYVVFFIAFSCCIFDFVNNRSIKNIFYFFLSIGLILLPALREVGTDNDSVAYQEMFQSYSNSSIQQIMEGGYGYVEKGYVFLNYFLSKVTNNFNVLLFFVAVLTGILNYSYILKNSSYPFISLLFYLAFFYLYRDFTQIRYGLSCSIFFWSTHYYLKKSYLKFALLLSIAILFHNSAFIMLPALLCIMLIDNKWFYLILPFLFFIIGRTFNLLLVFLSYGLGSDHLSIYEDEASGGSISISVIGGVLILLSVFLHGFTNSNVDRKRDFYWKMVSLGASFNLLTLDISIFQRFSNVLFQFSIVLIPFILNKLRFSVNKLEIFMVLYFLISLFLVYYGVRMINVNLIRPYSLL